MYKYAQIDSNNICFAVSYLSGEVIADDMIRLSAEDEPLGKKYNNGTWEEVPSQPAPESEPTEDEIIQAEMLLNQAQIIATQEEQDEVLAAILLNQMGV